MKSAEQKAKNVPTIRFAGFDDEWVEKKFGDTITIERGGSPRPIENFITENENGLNWVKIGDAPEQGNYITHTSEKIIPEGLSKTREVHPGDLILSNSMSFGRPYIMAIDGCIHDGWLLIRNSKCNYDLTFLCVLLGTENMLCQYKAMAAGSTVNNLNKELVASTKVSFPEVDEQQKLGSFFSNIDSLISLEQRKYDKLTQVKKSMLEKMFPKEGATVPEIRFAGFTGEWEKKKLGNIGIVIDPHPSHRAPKEEPGGIPFIGIGDVDAMGVINRKTARPVSPLVYEDHHKRYDLSLPSLGLARVASLGKVIRLRADVGKYAVSPTMSVIQFNKTVDVDYVYSFMSTPIFQKQFEGKSNGSTRQSVGTEMVRILDVNIPPNINEQQKIGSYFSHLDSLISLQQRKLEKLKNIKKSLLEKMFV